MISADRVPEAAVLAAELDVEVVVELTASEDFAAAPDAVYPPINGALAEPAELEAASVALDVVVVLVVLVVLVAPLDAAPAWDDWGTPACPWVAVAAVEPALTAVCVVLVWVVVVDAADPETPEAPDDPEAAVELDEPELAAEPARFA